MARPGPAFVKGKPSAPGSAAARPRAADEQPHPGSGVPARPCQRPSPRRRRRLSWKHRGRGASFAPMRIWPVALAAIALAGIVAGGVVVGYRAPATPPPAAVNATPLSSPTPPAPPPIAAASPPRLAAAPDLPTVEVSPRPEHVVPDEDRAPPHPVTFQDRDRGGDVAPRVAAREAPPLPPAAVISGKARLGEGVSLI